MLNFHFVYDFRASFRGPSVSRIAKSYPFQSHKFSEHSARSMPCFNTIHTFLHQAQLRARNEWVCRLPEQRSYYGANDAF